MSKSNNLTDFLTDIADTIRTKKGYSSTQKINPQNFSSEIFSINPALQIKTVSASAIVDVVVTPDSDYQGLSEVTVNKVNLSANKIRSGASILGVTGDYGPLQQLDTLTMLTSYSITSGFKNKLQIHLDSDSSELVLDVDEWVSGFNRQKNTMNFSSELPAGETVTVTPVDSNLSVVTLYRQAGEWGSTIIELDDGVAYFSASGTERYVYIITLLGYRWVYID